MCPRKRESVVRWPSRRMLPTVIGVFLALTIAADLVVVMRAGPGVTPRAENLVAASQVGDPVAVPRLQRSTPPPALVAAPQTLPADAVQKVRQLKGVKNVEPVDAARAVIAGKRVGVLGVEPSTFRAYTPTASARSDALWRNISGGDIAISFTMGNDGGIPLASWTQIGGTARPTPGRGGADATMGISDVDAGGSPNTARLLGQPAGTPPPGRAPPPTNDKPLRGLATP